MATQDYLLAQRSERLQMIGESRAQASQTGRVSMGE